MIMNELFFGYKTNLLYFVADLEENVGKCPLEEMGFKEWGEFLYAIRDIFHVHHFYHEDPTNPRTRLFLFVSCNLLILFTDQLNCLIHTCQSVIADQRRVNELCK